jgi:hypothetical protein
VKGAFGVRQGDGVRWEERQGTASFVAHADERRNAPIETRARYFAGPLRRLLRQRSRLLAPGHLRSLCYTLGRATLTTDDRMVADVADQSDERQDTAVSVLSFDLLHAVRCRPSDWSVQVRSRPLFLTSEWPARGYSQEIVRARGGLESRTPDGAISVIQRLSAMRAQRAAPNNAVALTLFPTDRIGNLGTREPAAPILVTSDGSSAVDRCMTCQREQPSESHQAGCSRDGPFMRGGLEHG